MKPSISLCITVSECKQLVSSQFLQAQTQTTVGVVT